MKASKFLFMALAIGFLFDALPAWGQPRPQFATGMAASNPPIEFAAAEPIPGPMSSEGGLGARFGGTVEPLPPNWDSYATPGATPQPLFPEDPNLQYGMAGFTAGATAAYGQARKFFHGFRFGYLWMPGNSADELGIHDVELDGTFEFPFLWNQDSPLLVTPGFAVHYWSGPVSQGTQPADMPPRTYDAFLDAAWNPQPTPWLGAELSFRIGVYSDFAQVVNDSIRYMGKGLLVLQPTGTIQVKGGIWYLDRNKIKLFPAGGIVWTPTSDTRFEFLFPNPKYAKRISNMGNVEFWFTLTGEYGGGNWTIRRADVPNTTVAGIIDSVDYNDIRIGVGLEFNSPNRFSGLLEFGVAFERELVYRNGPPDEFRPNTTIYLKTGFSR